jgi:hypothetical protein
MDALLDQVEDVEVEAEPTPSYFPRMPSTAASRERYAFLKTKRVGDTWNEGPGGRYLYLMGRCGVTVFDTSRWGKT